MENNQEHSIDSPESAAVYDLHIVNEELKMQCLSLATELSKEGKDHTDVLSIAKKYYKWIKNN